MVNPSPPDNQSSLDLSLYGFGFDEGDRWIDEARAAREIPLLGNIGAYELVEEVSRGGQGVVFRAVQPGTGRNVAVKRLLAGALASDASRRRFHREIAAASSLNHPCIVTVYGVDESEGLPVLAMEWIDGVTLDRWIAASSHEPRRAIDLFLRICDAVTHAHSRGVIHRDLKPGNVMVDVDDQPHVLDFGIAKWAFDPNDDLTRTRDFVGTPAYASPEQLRSGGEGVDERSDVYSLGALLYELLTGQPPHGKEVSLSDRLLGERRLPLRASQLNRKIDRELDAILQAALAPDRDERYSSVSQLEADLRRHRAGLPVVTVSTGTGYLLRKLIVRHCVSVGVAAMILVILCGGSGALYVQNQHLNRLIERERDARCDAEAERERADALRLLADEESKRVAAFLVYQPSCLLRQASLNPEYRPSRIPPRDDD